MTELHPQTARRRADHGTRAVAYRDGYAAGERMAAADVRMLRDRLTAQQRETLRVAQEAERLRAALEEIVYTDHQHDVDELDEQDWCPRCIARRALGGEGE